MQSTLWNTIVRSSKKEIFQMIVHKVIVKFSLFHISFSQKKKKKKNCNIFVIIVTITRIGYREKHSWHN